MFQLLTALLHSFSLFVRPEGSNDTERQMMTHRFDMGGGFHPTAANLMTALSSCFLFVCLLGGLTLGYLLWKQTEPNVMKGVIGINLIVFGAIFAVMAVFTFLPPIILTGLIFVNLLAAFLVVPKVEAVI